MATRSKLSVGVVIAGVVFGLVLVAMLLVGSCTAFMWKSMGGDSESGARRDALRARYAALTTQLRSEAEAAGNIAEAAARLRGVALPPEVMGLAITQADSDDNRAVLLRNYDGRQTRRLLVNGAGSVTLEARDGTRRTFDLLEVDAMLRDGVAADIELVLAREDVAPGPE